MSLRVLTQVWEHAKAQGGDLLVLLALADEARDNGGCYPGIDRIARKARMTERNVRYVLRRLEKSGELAVVPGGGRANTNLYEIRVTPNLELGLPERGQIFPKPGKTAPERGQSATETRKPSAPEPLDLKATKGGRGTRLPPDWKPSPDLQAWALAERPDLNHSSLLAMFCDHWRAVAGARGVKLDWDATYRNWVRKEKPPFGAPTPASQQPTRTCARGADCLAPGPLGSYTRMAIGNVCNKCREAYMDGKWKDEIPRREPAIEHRP